jgi:hypothetical protein
MRQPSQSPIRAIAPRSLTVTRMASAAVRGPAAGWLMDALTVIVVIGAIWLVGR